MDINSPINLWKDYDIAALPFNTTQLSPKTYNEKTVREYYFDGFTTVDGRVRAFLKIVENPDAIGTILYMSGENGVEADMVEKLYSLGYSVALLDYMGKSDDLSRYTLYPQSLSSCNRRSTMEFESTSDEQLSHWYIWTCIARRAVRFIADLNPNKKIFALGVGLGGSTVYKLAAFDDGLTACATLLNILPNVIGEGNAIINYHASLDCIAYAPITKIPLFMAIASNDADGSLDEMSDLAENTKSLRRFRIIERAFASSIKNILAELYGFFSECANGSAIKPWPSITASNSAGSLYFNIDINRPEGEPEIETDAQIKLFVSFCIDEAPYRNWMCIPAISLGKDKFISKINVCQNDKDIHAFANMIYPNGDIKSSTVLTISPKSLGITARPGVGHRKIYDGSMGEDGWTTRYGGTISTVRGPFDIDGVTSDDNTIITFKPGDLLFKVSADTLLQIMICGQPQKVNIIVHDKQYEYSCSVDITETDAWQKFSLSHMNFKGQNGTLTDWSQILMLELDSETTMIVGSVLWV